MAHASRTFRVFVSSTFNDLKVERNALQEKVYPRLKELCAQYGTRFQAVDLRWGVSEEADLDQQTMNICLGEIARCQMTSPRPNFIVLLGDRYGWRPLPPQIPADKFEQIRNQRVDEKEKNLLDTWYKRDDNAIPPEYILQPRSGDLEKYQDQGLWERIEAELRQILLTGMEKITLPAEEKINFIASATEQEVFNGALKIENAGEHVFCFFRQIEELPINEKTRDFQNLLEIDKKWIVDRQAQDQLEKLKTSLRKALPENIEEYIVQWGEEKQLPADNHINKLCEDVYARLEKVILSEIEKLEQIDPLQREIHAHQAFAEQRARIFVGRENILDKIEDYINGTHSNPLTIWGKSGTGKSALMAKAIQQAQSDHNSNLIFRFVSVTPDASNGRSLLESLCRQITQAYGGDETTIPSEYNELVHEFPNRFGLVTTQKPLILFIDALNQISDADNAKDLDWLPSELPKNVRIIISTIPGPCLEVLQNKLPAENLVELSGLSAADGTLILDKWLEESERTLQSEQRSHLIKQFAGEGNALYLKLAFEEARRWKSYDWLPSGADAVPGLSPDIPGILRDLFWRLSQETHHGQLMVSRSLGNLAASRYGLSEDEILDVLSLDKEIGREFQRRSPYSPAFTRLPVVLWSRLYYDLEPYMTEVDADGIRLMSFYHPQLAQAISEEFLQGEEKVRRHQMLAAYFGETPLFVERADEKTPNLRRLSEQPWQLAQAGSWQKLHDLLVDLPFFAAVWEKNEFEVKAYWAQIEGASSLRLVNAYHPVITTPGQYAAAHIWKIASLLKDTGHLEAALSLGEYLVEYSRKTGNQGHLVTSLGSQALILYDRGNLEGAMALHKEGEHICRELGDKVGLHISLGNQALILKARGNLEGAMALHKEKERICRELGDKAGLGVSLGNQARILFTNGNLEGAMALYKEQERISCELGDKAGLHNSLGSQAVILKIRGDLRGAMALHKKEELICRELGNKTGLATSLINQASILGRKRNQTKTALSLADEAYRLASESGHTDLAKQIKGIRAKIRGH